jgi:hypothetical protein
MVKFILGGSMYKGNFKSMKRKRVEKDPPTGSEGKVVKKSAFGGCGPAVKALYAGFKDLPYGQKDGLFMSRLMVIAMNVYKMDVEREMGKKSILFSKYKPFFYKLQFRKGENCIGNYLHKFVWSYPDSRLEATLEIKDFQNHRHSMPTSASVYRFYLHLSVISDRVFSEEDQKYVSLSGSSGLSVIVFSEYVEVWTKFNGSMVVSFPEGTVLTDADTVIQCVGFEYYYKSGPFFEAYLGGSGVEVVDVF